MAFAQKTIYALRAMYELAKREGQGQVSIPVLAQAQRIPPRFLENILVQLKQAGLVRSVRGKEGGYFLARPARALTVADVLFAVEDNLNPVSCLGSLAESSCPMREECAFLPMWTQVRDATLSIYTSTTFHALIEQGKPCPDMEAFIYTI